ncbi:hypothetical protein evm_003694 [Chilo suppressalis]|nr:hypothetical protein evm_003694 [Chilo suppressalis]
MSDINSEFCICCRRSLNRIGGSRRRSYYLTAEFMQTHPQLMAYFVEIANIRQFRDEDKVCRPCLQRAQRYNFQGNAEIHADARAEVTAEQDVEGDADQSADVVSDQPAEVAADETAQAVISAAAVQNHQDQGVQVNLMRTKLNGYKRAPFNTRA